MTTIEASTKHPEIDLSALLPPSLRDDFPILTQNVHGDHPLVFLDNAASTQRPRQVIEVLRRVYERDYANVHRGIHTLSERSTEQYEEAREKVRAFVDDAALAGLDEVRVVHGRGTGAVRAAVRDELARHPLVGKTEPDSHDGATLVQLAG